MREIKAIIRPERLPEVLHALHALPGLPGVTVSTVEGYGRVYPPGTDPSYEEVRMTKLEIVVPADATSAVVEAVERAAHTGRVGDGKIFVYNVEQVVKIRSGERDVLAL